MCLGVCLGMIGREGARYVRVWGGSCNILFLYLFICNFCFYFHWFYVEYYSKMKEAKLHHKEINCDPFHNLYLLFKPKNE